MKPLTDEQRKLVEDNIRWADSVSGHYWKEKALPDRELEEIIANGRFGLIRAASKWDQKKCNKFRDYASFCVVREIMERARVASGIKTKYRSKATHVPYNHGCILNFPWDAIDSTICYNQLLVFASKVLKPAQFKALQMWLNGYTHKEIGRDALGGTGEQNSLTVIRGSLKHLRKETNIRDKGAKIKAFLLK